MGWDEVDRLKRDLAQLQNEVTLSKSDLDRKVRQVSSETNEADRRLDDLTARHEELVRRVNELETAVPVDPAALLAAASSKAATLLALIAGQGDAAVVRVLEAAAATLPSRTISTDGDPYLTRYYVWPGRPRDDEDSNAVDPAPFAVFLHKFHRGDLDRDQHNHPWDVSVALVLAGGYREERGTAVKTYVPGMLNVIRGDDFHRVDLLDPAAGSWSLFIAGRKTEEWGFKDAASGVVIPWQTYLASRAMRR